MALKIGNLSKMFLGYSGENETRTIRIDVSSWLEKMPGAVISLIVRRPDAEETYTPHAEVVDGILSWTIRKWDTSIPGCGDMQIKAAMPGGTGVYMSRIVPTVVMMSLESGGEIPTPGPGGGEEGFTYFYDSDGSMFYTSNGEAFCVEGVE